MARVIIKPTKINMERGDALRLAAIDGRSTRMHVRVSELDREYTRMEEHMHKVVATARATI